MIFPTLFWILFIVSAVLCAVGFYRFVWFMSVGYGLAVAGCGAAMLIAAMAGGRLYPVYAVICIIFIIYGCRLGLFLLIRELKSADYRKTLNAQVKPVPIFVKIIMWILLALLYPIQVSPVLYRLTNNAMNTGNLAAWIGALIMLIGVLIESLADKQKSDQKKLHPHMAATKGLFRICRCPNYFGEILVWTGCIISGLPILKGFQWIIALFGYICIVAIMISGAKRLEKRQNKNYGDKKEYRDYANTTPILIPFVPIYHLVKDDRIMNK